MCSNSSVMPQNPVNPVYSARKSANIQTNTLWTLMPRVSKSSMQLEASQHLRGLVRPQLSGTSLVLALDQVGTVTASSHLEAGHETEATRQNHSRPQPTSAAE